LRQITDALSISFSALALLLLLLGGSMKELKMSDIGTRLEHLSDLYDLWKRGLEILSSGVITSGEDERKKELEIALQMLWFHMNKDYDPRLYITTVNALPKDANEIKRE
jgi:hypothetical protein